MKTQIASFDIGKKNFAFYIEEFETKELEEIKNLEQKERYNKDGTATNNMHKILNAVCASGLTVLHKNLDLTKNCDKKKKLDPETFHNLNEVLEEYSPYFDKCSAFVIEQQMNFGKCRNNMALKLGQHCYSWFTIKYGKSKKIVEFPAYHKTQVMGAPKVKGKKTKTGYRWKAMAKPQRKKWAVNKAIEILTCRGEIDVLDGVTTVAKKDDLADTLLQLQAYKYLTYVG